MGVDFSVGQEHFQEQGNQLLYGEASSEAAPQHDAYGEYVDNEFADFGLMELARGEKVRRLQPSLANMKIEISK
ncbi:hypothetical protein HAX54_028572 [Datura stramonium]|uniref:Uncharacterized protein n=1 Tax=Datura stramonium TaxID=4076 RepID=A0ABS8S9P0_DATST|nr:hypothetical protein [Datura stramonium]